jgi:serine phosphatase RsbU (regulator of sigma subunit)
MEKFVTHELDIKKGDTIYLFSDGFLDQFGGPDGRKFMKPRFRQMLLDNQYLNMSDQKELFTRILNEWMNYSTGHDEPFGQIDDIILLGIRI